MPDLLAPEWEFLYTNTVNINIEALRKLLDKDINLLHFVIDFVTSLRADDFTDVGELLKAAAVEAGRKPKELMKLMRLVLYGQPVGAALNVPNNYRQSNFPHHLARYGRY